MRIKYHYSQGKHIQNRADTVTADNASNASTQYGMNQDREPPSSSQINVSIHNNTCTEEGIGNQRSTPLVGTNKISILTSDIKNNHMQHDIRKDTQRCTEDIMSDKNRNGDIKSSGNNNDIAVGLGNYSLRKEHYKYEPKTADYHNGSSNTNVSINKKTVMIAKENGEILIQERNGNDQKSGLMIDKNIKQMEYYKGVIDKSSGGMTVSCENQKRVIPENIGMELLDKCSRGTQMHSESDNQIVPDTFSAVSNESNEKYHDKPLVDKRNNFGEMEHTLSTATSNRSINDQQQRKFYTDTKGILKGSKRKITESFNNGRRSSKEVTFADDIASYRFYEPNPDEYQKSTKRPRYSLEIGDLKFNLRKKKHAQREYRCHSGKLSVIDPETKKESVFIPKNERQQQAIKFFEMFQQRKDRRLQRLNLAQAAFKKECLSSEPALEMSPCEEISVCKDLELFEYNDELKCRPQLSTCQIKMDDCEDDNPTSVKSHADVSFKPESSQKNQCATSQSVENIHQGLKKTHNIRSSNVAISHTKQSVCYNYNECKETTVVSTYIKSKNLNDSNVNTTGSSHTESQSHNTNSVTKEITSHSQVLASANITDLQPKQKNNNDTAAFSSTKYANPKVAIAPNVTSTNVITSEKGLHFASMSPNTFPKPQAIMGSPSIVASKVSCLANTREHISSNGTIQCKPLFTSSLSVMNSIEQLKKNNSQLMKEDGQLQCAGVPIVSIPQIRCVAVSTSSPETKGQTNAVQTPIRNVSEWQYRCQSNTKEPIFKVPYPVHSTRRYHANIKLETNDTNVKNQIRIAEAKFKPDKVNQMNTMIKSNISQQNTFNTTKQHDNTNKQQHTATTNMCSETQHLALKTTIPNTSKIILPNRDSVVYSSSSLKCTEGNDLFKSSYTVQTKNISSSIVPKETIMYPLGRRYLQSKRIVIKKENEPKRVPFSTQSNPSSKILNNTVCVPKKVTTDSVDEISRNKSKCNDAMEIALHFEEITRNNVKLFGENDWQCNNVQKKLIPQVNCEDTDIKEEKDNDSGQENIVSEKSLSSEKTLDDKTDADACQNIPETSNKQDIIRQVNDIIQKDKNLKLINDMLNEASSNINTFDNQSMDVVSRSGNLDTNTTKIKIDKNVPSKKAESKENIIMMEPAKTHKLNTNNINKNRENTVKLKEERSLTEDKFHLKEKDACNHIIDKHLQRDNNRYNVNHVNGRDRIGEYAQYGSISNGGYLAELTRIEEGGALNNVNSEKTSSNDIDMSLAKESPVINGSDDDLASLTPTIYTGLLTADSLPNEQHSLINLETSNSEKELCANSFPRIESIKPVEKVDWHSEWKILNDTLSNYATKVKKLEETVDELKSQISGLEGEVKGKTESIENLETNLGQNRLLYDENVLKSETKLLEKELEMEKLKQKITEFEQKEKCPPCKRCSELQTCMQSQEVIRFIDLLSNAKQRNSDIELDHAQPGCSYISESSTTKRKTDTSTDVDKEKKPRMEVAPLSESSAFSVENKNCKVDLVPGSGVYVSRTELCTLKLKARDSATMMMRFMLELFFTIDKLASCSAAGRGHAKRPALDSNITTAVITYIKEQFPGTTDGDMMQAINQKCTDARKIIRRRRSREHTD